MASRSSMLAFAAVALVLSVSGATSAAAASLSGLAVTSSANAVALAGDSVVWSEGSVEPGRLSIEAANAVYRAALGGQVQEIFRAPAPRRGRVAFPPVLDASDQILAIGSGEEEVAPDGFSDPVWSEIRVGRLTGQLAIAVKRDVALDERSFAVSGDALATIELQAPRASRCVVRIREVPNGQSVTVGPQLDCAPFRVPSVRLAGPWTATLSASGERSVVTVYRWSTGETAYKLPVPGRLVDALLDLQDDGTVSVSDRTGVSWASIAEPRLHPVPTPRRMSSVRLASGRLAYVRRRASYKAKPHDPSSEVVVQPLDGPARAVSFPVALAEALDFDGSRIALLTDQCVYEGDVSSRPAPSGPPLGTCPGVAISLTPELADFPKPGADWNPSTRTLTTRVFCELSGADGCAGALTVTGHRRRTGRSFTVATGSFTAPRFGVSHARLRLAPTELAALRRKGQRAARVTVTATARDESDRQVAARRSFTLRLR